MKKFNKKKAVTLAALLAMAVLTQACGKSSGSASGDIATNGVIGTGIGGFVNPANGTIYGACNNIGAVQSQLGGSTEVSSANLATASDGASVCKVSMVMSLQYSGSRYYLGPNVTQSNPGNTGILLSPYDQAQISVSGTYTTGFFGGCGSNSVSGLMYGYVAGLNTFQVGTALPEVPVNGGGYLEIGLNQSSGSGGMCIQLQAAVTRCIDSAGSTHPC